MLMNTCLLAGFDLTHERSNKNSRNNFDFKSSLKLTVLLVYGSDMKGFVSFWQEGP